MTSWRTINFRRRTFFHCVNQFVYQLSFRSNEKQNLNRKVSKTSSTAATAIVWTKHEKYFCSEVHALVRF